MSGERSRLAAGLGTVLFTVVVPGGVTIAIPAAILASEAARREPGPVAAIVGVAAIVVGGLVYLRCAWDFVAAGRGTPAPIAAPQRLVVRGLYRHVRNPMYVGVLTILVGEAAVFGSTGILLEAATAALAFTVFVRFWEEPRLAQLFGDDYERYRRAVPRWGWRLRPWREAED